MSKSMTIRQERLYKLIKEYILENEMPPTLRELAEILGVTHCAVRDQLKYMESKGYVRLVPNTARGIRILN